MFDEDNVSVSVWSFVYAQDYQYSEVMDGF